MAFDFNGEQAEEEKAEIDPNEFMQSIRLMNKASLLPRLPFTGNLVNKMKVLAFSILKRNIIKKQKTSIKERNIKELLYAIFCQ